MLFIILACYTTLDQASEYCRGFCRAKDDTYTITEYKLVNNNVDQSVCICASNNYDKTEAFKSNWWNYGTSN